MGKFWLENPVEIFKSLEIVPLDNMRLSDQINALTRLLVFLFILAILFDCKYSYHFFCLGLIILIFIYYFQNNKAMTKEGFTVEFYEPPPKTKPKYTVEFYEPIERFTQPSPDVENPDKTPYDLGKLADTSKIKVNGKEFTQNLIQMPEHLYFCNDNVPANFPNAPIAGLNQKLATLNGQTEHPAMRIKPVVIAPTHDLTYWQDNNLIWHNGLNKTGNQQEQYLSGYVESSCCDYTPAGTQVNYTAQPIAKEIRENYTIHPMTSGNNCTTTPIEACMQNNLKENYGNTGQCRQAWPNGPRVPIVSPVPVEDNGFIPTIPVAPVRENYGNTGQCRQAWPNGPRVPIVSPVPVEDNGFIPTIPVAPVRENYEPLQIRPAEPGEVNTSCGYNPDQTLNYLPSNYAAGNCEQDPKMAQYNKNLFTQIIQPGVYTRTQVNEPVNSNIGISFQQQFEPLEVNRDDNGLNYLERDPRIIEPVITAEDSKPQFANYDTVYDPRFYGYGTSYRSYIDPMTKQPKFYYDDINAIRMPNYVVRSNVDHLPYADRYGPMMPDQEDGNNNPQFRSMVQDSWMRNSIQFRNDITERAMRKSHAIAWQKRQSPLGANLV
jgi:hypothetical protein